MVDSLTLWIWGVVALNLVIATGVMCLLRFGSGVLFKVDTRDELAERDNFAFGIAIAGGIVGVTLILAAATSGEPELTYMDEFLLVITYGAVGLALLKIGMLINDFLVLPGISIREQIKSKNLAAGVVQAANLAAIGVLVNGAMNWSEGALEQALLSVVIVFILSQIVLLAVTRTRFAIYARRNQGHSWQEAIEAGNTALGIRYSGHLIGTALAASSAGGLVAFSEGIAMAAWMTYLIWLAWALALAAVLLVLSMLAQRAILGSINVVEEVDKQRNAGIAFIEAAVFIGLGLIIKAAIMG